ncbi:MAG TPA: GntR family transcriptional regulator [Jiangellaceae bacterium]
MNPPIALQIDTAAAEPPYEQIRAQVVELIASGELLPGTRLPTVRQLAADLGLAANTVARAYRELEQAGAVVTARRAGTRVATPQDSGGSYADADAHRLDAAADAYVATIRRLAVDDEAASAAVRRALRRHPAGPSADR